MSGELAPQALVWLDESGSVTSLNQAAAVMLDLQPASVLGRPASLVPGPVGKALSRPGAPSPYVRWLKEESGWRARLLAATALAVKRIALDLAREVLMHDPNPDRAREVLAGALSEVADGRPWALWAFGNGSWSWWAGEGEDLPFALSPDSLVLKLGRPASLPAGEGIAAVEGWPPSQASSAWPIVAKGRIEGVACFGGPDPLPSSLGEEAAALARAVMAREP